MVFFGYEELDANQKLMDTPASGVTNWSNSTPSTGTIAVSASGQSISYTPVGAGTDTISFSFVVGSDTFAATADIIVLAAPQVLTSVNIVKIPASV